jgi:hypothetical protein
MNIREFLAGAEKRKAADRRARVAATAERNRAEAGHKRDTTLRRIRDDRAATLDAHARKQADSRAARCRAERTLTFVPTGGKSGERSYDVRTVPGLENTWRFNGKEPDADKFTPCTYRPRKGK